MTNIESLINCDLHSTLTVHWKCNFWKQHRRTYACNCPTTLCSLCILSESYCREFSSVTVIIKYCTFWYLLNFNLSTRRALWIKMICSFEWRDWLGLRVSIRLRPAEKLREWNVNQGPERCVKRRHVQVKYGFFTATFVRNLCYNATEVPWSLSLFDGECPSFHFSGVMHSLSL